MQFKRSRVVSGRGLGALDCSWEGVEVWSGVVVLPMADGGWVGGFRGGKRLMILVQRTAGERTRVLRESLKTNQ